MAMWIITKDKISKGKRVGTKSANYDQLSFDVLCTVLFRMRDDDGHVYYEGKATPDCEFEPLDDFGMPNDGCTEIQYKNEKGEWETL